jgi:uncharacterized protein YyaL (SSP411 family)
MMDAEAAPRHVAIVAGSGLDAMVAEARRAAGPRDALLVVDATTQARVAALAPFVAPLVARDGKATAYVCVERMCHAPTTDPAVLARDLQE